MAETPWQAGDPSLAIQTIPSRDGCQQVVITATREGFSASRDPWLDAGDIDRFADQVHHMCSSRPERPNCTVSMASSSHSS